VKFAAKRLVFAGKIEFFSFSTESLGVCVDRRIVEFRAGKISRHVTGF
jgi:hypothetical protein